MVPRVVQEASVSHGLAIRAAWRTIRDEVEAGKATERGHEEVYEMKVRGWGLKG